MAVSVKELVERRAKLVHDSRVLAWAECPTTEQMAQCDAMLEEAGKLDLEIQALTDKAARQDRLKAAIDAAGQAKVGRQVPPVPVDALGGDGAALTVPFGRHQLRLERGTLAHRLATAEYGESYRKWLLAGAPSGRGEQLGLTTSDNKQGGYLAPMGMLSGLIKFLDDNVIMRQLCTVLPPTTEKSVGVLTYDADPADAEWTAEVPAADITEDSAARIGKREMMPHLLTKLLKMSSKILRNSSLDLLAFLTERLGYKFAVTEEKAFLTGTGAQQPLGVFTPSADGISAGRDFLTGSATNLTYDGLVDAFMELKEAYQARATWIISRAFLRRARKLKSSAGDPLFTDSMTGGAISAGNPGLILNRPYRVSEFVPGTFTASQYVGIVGDFSQYYIQDGLGLVIENLYPLFRLKQQEGLMASKETDAQPVLEEAFVRLKTDAS